MQQRDRAAFAELMHAVYALYRSDLSDAVLGIWWEAMRPFELDAVRDALNRHAISPDAGQYLPKPADVIRLLAGSTLDAAQLAWTKVQRAVRQAGAYVSVAFDDALVHAVLDDMGGWTTLCARPEKDLPFVEREFVERYRGYRTRGALERYPRYLPGLAEAHNASRGFASPAPLLIGDPVRAAAVMEGGAESTALPMRPLAALLAAPKERAA